MGTRVLVPSHQNFGSLTFFWVDFNKIGKYQGYIKTFRNKEKIKFLMLVLESKKQGNYSLRRPPKLIIPQAVIRH